MPLAQPFTKVAMYGVEGWGYSIGLARENLVPPGGTRGATPASDPPSQALWFSLGAFSLQVSHQTLGLSVSTPLQSVGDKSAYLMVSVRLGLIV